LVFSLPLPVEEEEEEEEEAEEEVEVEEAPPSSSLGTTSPSSVGLATPRPNSGPAAIAGERSAYELASQRNVASSGQAA
jgi:hypothetical protein